MMNLWAVAQEIFVMQDPVPMVDLTASKDLPPNSPGVSGSLSSAVEPLAAEADSDVSWFFSKASPKYYGEAFTCLISLYCSQCNLSLSSP